MSVSAAFTVPQAQSLKKIIRKCEKCNVNRGVVNASGCFCRECLVTSTKRRFTETITAKCGLKKFDKVVIGFDGSLNSTSLLNIMQNGLILERLPLSNDMSIPANIIDTPVAEEDEHFTSIVASNSLSNTPSENLYSPNFPILSSLTPTDWTPPELPSHLSSILNKKSSKVGADGFTISLVRTNGKRTNGFPLRGVIVYIDDRRVKQAITLGAKSILTSSPFDIEHKRPCGPLFVDEEIDSFTPRIRYVNINSSLPPQDTYKSTHLSSTSSIRAENLEVLPVLCIPLELVVPPTALPSDVVDSIEARRKFLLDALITMAPSHRMHIIRVMTSRMLINSATSLNMQHVVTGETIDNLAVDIVRNLCSGTGSHILDILPYSLKIQVPEYTCVSPLATTTSQSVIVARPFRDMQAKTLGAYATFTSLAFNSPTPVARDRLDVDTLCAQFVATVQGQNEASVFNLVRTSERLKKHEIKRTNKKMVSLANDGHGEKGTIVDPKMPKMIEKYMLPEDDETEDEEEAPSCGTVDPSKPVRLTSTEASKFASESDSEEVDLAASQDSMPCRCCGHIVRSTPDAIEAQLILLSELPGQKKRVSEPEICSWCNEWMGDWKHVIFHYLNYGQK